MPHIRRTQRVGLLTPSSNTTQEPEFVAMLPREITLHTGRLSFTNIDADTMLRCVEELERESRKLADAEVGVIILAATAPSLTLGRGYDRELIERMEAASGTPATTASTAFIDALTALGARRIAMAAPWSEAMNRTAVSFFEANGLEVVHHEVMGYVSNIELGRADPETAYELGRRADRPQADAIILPGGNWPALSIVERLERDTGKPVLTNNTVSVWAVLRMLQHHGGITGCGRLLDEHLGREAQLPRGRIGSRAHAVESVSPESGGIMPHTRRTHRIGLLAPSSNTTQEPEFVEVLPHDVTLHTGRLGLRTIDADSTERIVEELEQESRKLADAEVGVIVLSATAPSSRKGKGYDRELIRRMSEASGRPATTAATALIEALTVLGVRRIVIAAPWTTEVNLITASFIEAHGFEVLHHEARGLISNTEVGRLDPQVPCEMGRGVNRPEADAVLLACGNWWTMSIVEQLEQEIGKPVLSTNGVSLWAALRILRSHDSIPGYGTLLRDHLVGETVSRRRQSAV